MSGAESAVLAELAELGKNSGVSGEQTAARNSGGFSSAENNRRSFDFVRHEERAELRSG